MNLRFEHNLRSEQTNLCSAQTKLAGEKSTNTICVVYPNLSVQHKHFFLKRYYREINEQKVIF